MSETETLAYTPIGETDDIELSEDILLRKLIKPTKRGHLPDKKDLFKFIHTCRTRKLNPFAGDCFLVGYFDKDSNSTSWVVIIATLAYYKRAERSPQYEGSQAGLLVQTKSTGAITERDGDMVFPGEVILGGWCRVYRKDRRIPIYRTRQISNRMVNKGTDAWKKDPAGMIRNAAQKAALNEAFPNEVGALYSTDDDREETDEQPAREYKEIALPPGLTALVEATDTPVYDEAEAAAEAIEKELAADPVTAATAEVQTQEGPVDIVALAKIRLGKAHNAGDVDSVLADLGRVFGEKIEQQTEEALIALGDAKKHQLSEKK